jgi:hypothetical protein
MTLMVGGDTVVDLSAAGNIIPALGKQHRATPHALLEMTIGTAGGCRIGADLALCEE